MNPIKPTIKTELMPVTLITAGILLAFYFYSRFPETVPTHWNIAGEVDDWSSRAFGAFLLPIISIAIYILFLIIPYFDPKKERYAEFRKTYHIFKNLLLLAFLAIYLVSGLNILGYPVTIDFWVPLIIGILFISMGNYFGKIKPNWFMGIRTPWTLSSDAVWNKTHRFGGKVFITAGVIMSSMYFVNTGIRVWLFGTIMIVLVFGTMVYSYLIFRQEKKKNDTNNKQR